jgi:hypothetical protein
MPECLDAFQERARQDVAPEAYMDVFMAFLASIQTLRLQAIERNISAKQHNHHYTFNSKCSRSHELITFRKVSYSVSFTAVKASTKRSPSNSISGWH